jgi:hypothetical protein
MDNVIEVVALLRKHSELELQILNGHGAAVATERNWRLPYGASPHIPRRSTPSCRRHGRCGGRQIPCA